MTTQPTSDEPIKLKRRPWYSRFWRIFWSVRKYAGVRIAFMCAWDSVKYL